jgi:hypothetical protein
MVALTTLIGTVMSIEEIVNSVGRDLDRSLPLTLELRPLIEVRVEAKVMSLMD